MHEFLILPFAKKTAHHYPYIKFNLILSIQRSFLMNPIEVTLDKIVSLCKRKGFVYQSAEIYGGLNGVYDFGYLGHLLKENIRNAWTKSMYENDRGDILFIEGAI